MKRVTRPVPRPKKNRIKKDGTPADSNWGGYRPGAGRPTFQEQMSKRDQSVKSFRSRYPLQPLDYAMCILNDLDPKTKEPIDKPYSDIDKKWAVSVATPYLNQRLSALQVTGANEGPVQYSVDVRKLSDDELSHLEKIMSKASQPLEDNDNDDMDLDQVDEG